MILDGLGFCFMDFMAHEILGDMSNLVLSTESCKATCLLGNSKFNRLYTIIYIYIGYQFEFGSLPCLNDRREHIKLNIWNINMKHLFLVKCQRSDDSSIDAVVLGKV